jgi:hypothetical protein
MWRARRMKMVTVELFGIDEIRETTDECRQSLLDKF